MAQIVLALGTSHGPMLSTPPKDWGLRVNADRAEPAHPFRGAHYSFEQLLALRAGENLSAQTTVQAQSERAQRCAAALVELRRLLLAARPDVLVIVGNDQREVFDPGITPALWMFVGDAVFDEPVSADRLAKMPPGIAISSQAIKPSAHAEYPAHAPLANHLARHLTRSGFDFALSTQVPQRKASSPTGMPHAFSFIYQRLLKGQVPPHVPIMLNTFYPPNQPGAARCVDLGLALREAIDGWPDAARVALIASGGLSHFVIDEDFDAALLAAMQQGDMDGGGARVEYVGADVPQAHPSGVGGQPVGDLRQVAGRYQAAAHCRLWQAAPCVRAGRFRRSAAGAKVVHAGDGLACGVQVGQPVPQVVQCAAQPRGTRTPQGPRLSIPFQGLPRQRGIHGCPHGIGHHNHLAPKVRIQWSCLQGRRGTASGAGPRLPA